MTHPSLPPSLTFHLPLGHVNIPLFAGKVGETTTATLDGSHGVHDLVPAVNIGVEQTQNVLELTLFRNDNRLIEEREG